MAGTTKGESSGIIWQHLRASACGTECIYHGEREEARRQIQKLQLVNSASVRAEGYGNWERTQCYVISSRLHVFPRLKARSLHTFPNKSCEGLSLDPFLRENAIHMHVSSRPSSVNVDEVLKN